MSSILNDTKRVLGLDSTYTAFDTDILMHINTVFADLQQIGIGPLDGYAITGATELWSAYLGTTNALNSVKTYMYLRVKTLFDPPTTSYLINEMEEQIRKFEWRLNVQREGVSWTDPSPPPIS
jgi:hypothetical protein